MWPQVSFSTLVSDVSGAASAQKSGICEASTSLRLAAVVDVHGVLAATAGAVGVERAIAEVDHVVLGEHVPHAFGFAQAPYIPQGTPPLIGVRDRADRQVFGARWQDGPRSLEKPPAPRPTAALQSR